VGTGSFPEVKRPERGVYHPPHLAPKLKEKYSCTFTPLWAFMACYSVNFNFYFYKFLIVPRSVFLEWEMFQTRFVEKIKMNGLWSIILFFENLAVYEIRWKNILVPGRPQMTIWRTSIACCIPKLTNSLSEYVMLIGCPLLLLLLCYFIFVKNMLHSYVCRSV